MAQLANKHQLVAVAIIYRNVAWHFFFYRPNDQHLRRKERNLTDPTVEIQSPLSRKIQRSTEYREGILSFVDFQLSFK